MKVLKEFNDLMGMFQTLKKKVKKKDENLYEKWKEGGFLLYRTIDNGYPTLEEIVETLSEKNNEPENSESITDGFAGDVDNHYIS
jgi:hypothetical protein